MKRPISPHGAAIGLEVVSRESARCVFRLPYATHLVGDPDTGVLHGGVLTALLDNACGHSARDEDEDITIATLDLRIDYMGPATPGRDLFAAGHRYKRTRNVAFVRGVAYHDDPEDPVATCVATFMLGTPSSRAQMSSA